jgi:hypothetical protein
MKNLKVAVVLGFLTTAFAAPQAFADNYLCKTLDGGLGILVTHTVVPQTNGAGPQLMSTMALINPQAAENSQVVATFSPVDEILANTGADYLVRPTSSLSNPEAGKIYLGDTPINQLASIELHIASSNSSQLLDQGVLTLQRLNGSEVQAELVCARR